MAHKALGAGVRIMFSSVGLVAESVHHLKEKYSKSPTVSGIDVTAIGADLLQSPDHAHAEEVAYDVPPLYQEGDEAQWQLDEAQDELILTSSEATLSEEEREKAVIERQKSEKYNEHNPKVVFERFLERHPIPNHPPTAKLSLPVIASMTTQDPRLHSRLRSRSFRSRHRSSSIHRLP